VLRVLVTGAAGFVGSRLVDRMLAHPAFERASFTLSDSEIRNVPRDSRVCVHNGDLRDPKTRARLLAHKPELVFHLAGILGGAAEGRYTIAKEINVDATLALFEGLRDRKTQPRVIFTSSIAVFGPMPPDSPITDDTRPTPVMSYGCQKLMMEVALENFSARGELDGIALRLPGIVARADADESMKSSYLHRLFYAYAAGQTITLPVSPGGTSWLISVPACINALIHAALLPRDWSSGRRAFTLAAQRVSMSMLVEGLARQFPDSRSTVDFAPDPDLEAQFARQPPLVTALAEQLGFKHDGSIDALVRRAMEP
jgi:D-erythronate 2-dehydrogenase